jgi:D-sedoheptulose 7-phosphate isomerase
MNSFHKSASEYAVEYSRLLLGFEWSSVLPLVSDLERIRESGAQVFLIGNGGSAANALHWVNDLIYPLTKNGGKPIRAQALCANQASMTCLANDVGYERIFEHQLRSLANSGDVLISLSGSGNSPNILRALEVAKELGIDSHAILGFDGGKAKLLAKHVIHFPVNDMQLAEDFQITLCHILLQYLLISGK